MATIGEHAAALLRSGPSRHDFLQATAAVGGRATFASTATSAEAAVPREVL